MSDAVKNNCEDALYCWQEIVGDFDTVQERDESLAEYIWSQATASTDTELRALVEKLVGALSGAVDAYDSDDSPNNWPSCKAHEARQILAEAKLRGVV